MADAYQITEALERPSITVERGWTGRKLRRLLNRLPGVSFTEREIKTKTYTGRLLSDAEWRPYAMKLAAQGEGEEPLDADEQDELIRDLILAMDIPPSVVLELPGAAQREVIVDFLECQMRGQGIPEHLIEAIRANLRARQRASSTPNGSRTNSRTRPSSDTSRSPSSSTATGPSSTGAGTGSPDATSGAPETA